MGRPLLAEQVGHTFNRFEVKPDVDLASASEWF
jgi:hypothetical protein